MQTVGEAGLLALSASARIWAIGGAVILTTLLPMIRRGWWWVRSPGGGGGQEARAMKDADRDAANTLLRRADRAGE